MTKEKLASIKAYLENSNEHPICMAFTMLPELVAEVERLRELVKSAQELVEAKNKEVYKSKYYAVQLHESNDIDYIITELRREIGESARRDAEIAVLKQQLSASLEAHEKTKAERDQHEYHSLENSSIVKELQAELEKTKSEMSHLLQYAESKRRELIDERNDLKDELEETKIQLVAYEILKTHSETFNKLAISESTEPLEAELKHLMDQIGKLQAKLAIEAECARIAEEAMIIARDNAQSKFETYILTVLQKALEAIAKKREK